MQPIPRDRWCVFDLETTIKSHNGKKSPAFLPENYVVVAAWQKEGGDIQTRYFDTRMDGWFAEVICGVTLLVGMNIKFDLLYVCSTPSNKQAYYDFILRGGQIWDIQQAEYLLYAQIPAVSMLPLDTLSEKYGGEQKPDLIKELWNAGVCTSKISKDILIPYAIGDIENTRIVFEGQLKDATELDKQVILRHGRKTMLLTEMEHNGAAIDTEVLQHMIERTRAELVDCTNQLNEFVQGLPFEFNWNSTQQKSALLFGGVVEYKEREHLHVLGVPQYVMKTVKTPLFDEEGKPILFLSGKNLGQQKTKTEKVPDLTKAKWVTRHKEYIFEGYVKPEGVKITKTGRFSVDADTIEGLPDDIPFTKLLREQQNLSKMLKTYYEPIQNFTYNGLLHPNYNLCKTKTGRLSCDNPNLQNIPKASVSDTKKVFVSRYPNGSVLQCDATSLEVYQLANNANSVQFIEDLRSGRDFHLVTAAYSYGKTYEELLEKYNAGDAEVKAMRTKAKTIRFGDAYGSSPRTTAERSGTSVDDVVAYKKSQDERYPEVKQYHTKHLKALDTVGNFCYSNYYEGRLISEGVPTTRGFYRTQTGKRYSHKKEFSYGRLSWPEPQILNYSIQGDAGEYIYEGGYLALLYFIKYLQGKACLTMQVHDANYADAREDTVAEAAAVLRVSMERGGELFKLVDWELPIPVPAVVTHGRSLWEEKEVELTQNLYTTVSAKITKLLKDTGLC